MTHTRWLSPASLAIVVAIGCGGGTPRDASATTERATQRDEDSAPLRLAEAPPGMEAGQPAAAKAGAVGKGSIAGTAKLAGQPPAPQPVKMDADPVCQQQHATGMASEEVVADNGMLKNVFVYVKEGVSGSFPTPTAPVALEQSGCWYHPHVFGLQVNQPLEIVNSDATLHNVNAKPSVNQPFNVAQPVKGMKTAKKFAKPEVMVRFKCNVHPWMSAYAGVVAHPFFSVSGQDGSFAIANLPDGTYVIEAWHEKYGTQTQTVTVSGGETKKIELTFKAQ